MVRVFIFISLSIILLGATAQDDAIKLHLDLDLARSPKPGVSRRELETNVFSKRCTGTCAACFGTCAACFGTCAACFGTCAACFGTCAACFGTGYTLCPGSSITCYLPGDSAHGIDSCSSTGSSRTSTSSAPASTSTGSAGTSDLCFGTGATCVSCFGAGYLQCADGINCYNPNDPKYDTCPNGSTGGGSSSSTSCATKYGTGSVPCGSNSCYNPTQGDVCCADGYHCTTGYTCSTKVGKCCAPGSTNSGCSGSGSSSILTTSSYSYSYSSYNSVSSYTYATTSGIGATSPTTTAGSGSSTGTSQFVAAASSDRPVGATIVGVVLGFFGIGMLML